MKFRLHFMDTHELDAEPGQGSVNDPGLQHDTLVYLRAGTNKPYEPTDLQPIFGFDEYTSAADIAGQSLEKVFPCSEID